MHHRIRLFASESAPNARPWVIGLFQSFGNGGDAAEALNCSTPLVAASNPTGPVVAKCCSFVCGDATFAQLMAMADAGQIPSGVTYVACDETGPQEGIVQRTNWADPSVVGMLWDTAGSLARAGMAFQPSPPMPGGV